MTTYQKYLEIPSYDQCLKIVEECKAFSHSVQIMDGKEVHSFKYNINIEDMWEGFGRLNMRGIVFIEGKIVSLPFAKFFNLGEQDDTKNLDITNPKAIFLKVDGSLMSMFKIGDRIECKSMKSIYSDVSVACREYLKTRSDIMEYSKYLLDKNYSPMFEYVSPNSRIVILYEKQELYYLGCRNMSTGQTVLPNEIHVVNATKPLSIVTPQIFVRDEMDEFLKRESVDINEGVVVTLENGLMIKMKTEKYCKLHHIVTEISPKNIFWNIVNNTSDDAKGLLFQYGLHDDIKKMELIEKYYHKRFSQILKEGEDYYVANKHRERKDIAIELFRKPETKQLGSIVMNLIDGKKDSCFKLINRVLEDEICSKDFADFVA